MNRLSKVHQTGIPRSVRFVFLHDRSYPATEQSSYQVGPMFRQPLHPALFGAIGKKVKSLRLAGRFGTRVASELVVVVMWGLKVAELGMK